MKAVLAVFLCAVPAGASEFGRLEAMASDPALIAPGYTGERAASGSLVSGEASGARPNLTLAGAPSRRLAAKSRSGPETPKKSRKGRGLGRKLLILAYSMAFFAAGGLVIGAIVGSVAFALGAAWGLQALGTGAGIGAGLGFGIGFPAAFQEQERR